MKFEILSNGTLQISTEAEDAESISDIKERCGGDDMAFLHEMLEFTGWEANSRLHLVQPETVGALTDAVLHHEDGLVDVIGPVWWYPNYMVTNFADVLISEGKVMFPVGAPALVAA